MLNRTSPDYLDVISYRYFVYAVLRNALSVSGLESGGFLMARAKVDPNLIYS